MRTGLFIIAVTTIIFFINFVECLVPNIDPFSELKTERFSLRDYSLENIYNLKLNHIQRKNQYKIGFFGNSRILNLSCVGVNKSCFNFALTGESYRSSILLIKKLSEERKLPNMVVISLDNLEMQMYKSPRWLSFKERFHLLITDLYVVLTGEQVTRQKITRIMIRWAEAEYKNFIQLFEWSFLKRGLQNYFGLIPEPFPNVTVNDSGYLRDGSRKLIWRKNDLLDIAKAGDWIIPDLLNADFNILADISKKNNIRVILYEAPIHNLFGVKYVKNPSPYAKRDRNIIRQNCIRHKFECYFVTDNLIGTLPHVSDGWLDSEHPPEEMLSQWVSFFIKTK